MRFFMRRACFHDFVKAFPANFSREFILILPLYMLFATATLEVCGSSVMLFLLFINFCIFNFYKYIVLLLLVVSLTFIILFFARFLICIMHFLTGVICIWRKERKNAYLHLCAGMR